jgi:hypothetical protein
LRHGNGNGATDIACSPGDDGQLSVKFIHEVAQAP